MTSRPAAPDWTAISDDPNDPAARHAVHGYLTAIRQVHTDQDVIGFVERIVRGRSVLDVGVVAHSRDRFDQPKWRHGRIARAARHCLGVDILQAQVEELQAKGFNVVCADATSDRFLGERFEVVFIGDVLEHVDNMPRLLAFAARHLETGGRILATTPNPFSRKFYRRFRREGIAMANLDHVAWITPTQALEIARRAGIRLSAYHLVKRYSPLALAWRKAAIWRLEPLEWSFPDFIYEFG